MRFLSKAIVLALVFVLLVACASNDNNSGNQNTGSQSQQGNNSVSSGSGEKTKITYWTHERGRAQFLQDTVDRYNETNTDNIEVELTILSDNFAQAIDIAYSSGQSPDVYNVRSSQIGPLSQLIARDYLEPLDDYLTQEHLDRHGSMIVEGINAYEGKIYTLPNFGNSIRLIYNVDLLEKAGYSEPPTTLDEMVEMAKKITEVGKADGVYGFALPYKSANSALRRSAHAVVTLSGYERSGYDFKTGQYDFSGYYDVVQAFRQMWEDGSTLPGSESLDIDPLRAQFAEGKIGMYFSTDVEPGVFHNQFPTDINWAASIVPTKDGERNGVSLLDGGVWYGISKQSENKEAAWKFLDYMYSKQVLMESQEIAGWLSVVPEIVAEAKVPDIPGTEYFMAGKYDGIWPLPPADVIPEGRNFEQEFVDYIIVGGDLDEIIERLNERYNAALERADVHVEPDPDFDPSQLQGE